MLKTGAESLRGLGRTAGTWHFRVMSTITVPMPDEDLDFLRAYTQAQGISAETFLAQQAHRLRLHLQRPVHPVVGEASGIIQDDIAGEEAHREHLEKKHA